MRSFEPEDFETMTFNVYDLPANQNVLKTFPRLGKVGAFKLGLPKGLDRDKVIRWIIYMYDPGCPFDVITDEAERVLLCLDHAGFGIAEDEDFPDEVIEMVNNRIAEINEMIVSFWRVLRDPQYTHLKVQESIYYSLIRRVQKEPEKAKSSELKEAKAALIEAQNEFSGREVSQNLAAKMYEIIHREVLEISPEAIAKKVGLGEKLFRDVKASSGE